MGNSFAYSLALQDISVGQNEVTPVSGNLLATNCILSLVMFEQEKSTPYAPFTVPSLKEKARSSDHESERKDGDLCGCHVT
jgi:hypothetical protein